MAEPPQTISFLDALRKNRAGALLSGLIVMIAAALVLSAAVPSDLNTAIAVLLILLLAAAVGFAVKVTSAKVDAATLLTAGGLAAVGVPLLFGAGGAGYLAQSLGLSGADLSFDQSILMSLQGGFITVGSAIAAVVAIVIAAWGQRSK
jgi:hypothetical protein